MRTIRHWAFRGKCQAGICVPFCETEGLMSCACDSVGEWRQYFLSAQFYGECEVFCVTCICVTAIVLHVVRVKMF